MPLAACTIVAKNYLPFARVLARSFAERHPGGRFFVLLIDRNDGHFDPRNEDFEVIEAEELGNLPGLPSFLMKYTILEASTAIKPYFLEHLFARYNLADLVYFDPDILITGSLDELAALLHRHSIVLTPHLTSPIDDDAHPSELAILQAGAYNLGFLALRRSEVTERLLSWWKDRLYEQCLVRIDRGLFVDQKWMDLVPGIFGDVHVLDHPGYNVAYWNLHGREITAPADGEAADGWRSNGELLAFFHFSGVDPDNLELVSKHQDRFTLADLGDAATLYCRYRDLVMAAGYRESKPWPYAFGRFADGVSIPDAARSLYLALKPAERRALGDPFAAGGGFFRWLNEPARGGRRRPPYLTRLLAHLHASRSDLTASYPDVEGADFPAFCSWLDGYGRHELSLDAAFLATIHRESRATLLSVGGIRRRLSNRLRRLAASDAGKAAKRTAKRLLGRRRAEAIRRRLRPPRPPAVAPPSPRLRPPAAIERPGVNLVGYLQAETGMGEAARSLATAFARTDIPLSLHSLDLNVLARNEDPTFLPAASDFPYDVNLLVVNADQIPEVREHLGGEVFGGRYNVGFWLWELETFPEAFRGAFDPLHEVWTPSTFCADAISQLSPLPVRRVPLPVEPPVEKVSDRRHFGLPEDAFLFLFMFHYLSYVERKNPLAAVRAFRQAFSSEDDAVLVLKTSQPDFAPEAHDALRREIAGAKVRLIDDYLSRDEIQSLTALADCYVSLHRSEGYGLTLAEAMYHGKPVVATPYSGNADFMTAANAYPVDYRLVELGEDAGPYPAGGRWAEPDVDDAARQMRAVFDDRERARAVGERARADVRRELSLAAVGRLLERRFTEIVRQVHREGARRPHPT